MVSSNSSKVDLGNTITKSTTTKQISPAKRWCFTLNNYSDDDCSSISSTFREVCAVVIIGKEIGECGTPHLQGYVEFNVKCRPASHNLTKRIHWEKAKGNRESNVKYCSKDGDVFFTFGLPPPLKLISDDTMYPYQRKVLELASLEPEERKIFWFYGEKNIGKTQLLKVLCNPQGRFRSHILPSTKKHALAQVQRAELCYSFVFNLTADQSAYQTNELFSIMESVKDGLFSTNFGVDNNSMCVRNTSHIFVMANEPPDFSKTEIDINRFEIYNVSIDKCELVNNESLNSFVVDNLDE